MTLNPNHHIDDQIQTALQPYITDVAPIAVAVSGGGDSMAMLLALHFYTTQADNEFKFIALTVDHNLRLDSALEAEQVAEWCQALGIEHHILTWKFDQMPKSAIQEKARKARYQLMGEFCQTQGIEKLFVAHNLEDNEETFLMRLKRGAGLRGLSSIADKAEWWLSQGAKIQIIRPFLNIKRATLRLFLQQHQQQWVDDVSNENEKFERVQVRNFLSENALFETGNIAQSARRLAQADAAIEHYVENFWQISVRCLKHGIAAITKADFKQLPQELQLRLLARLVWTIGGQNNPPRWQKVENLAVQLAGEGRQFCLGNCLIVQKQDTLWFGREGRDAKNVEETYIEPQQKIEFQQRFYIRNHRQNKVSVLSYTIGSEPSHQWIERFDELKNCPKIIAQSIPQIVIENRQILPLADAEIADVEVSLKTRR